MTATEIETGAGIDLRGEVRPEWTEILSPEAVAFVAGLQREFNPRRIELLARREARKLRIDAGELPRFLPETQAVRDADWVVAPIPTDLVDRRVEITGP